MQYDLIKRHELRMKSSHFPCWWFWATPLLPTMTFDLWPSVYRLWFFWAPLQLLLITVIILTCSPLLSPCVYVFPSVRAHPHGSPSSPTGTPSSGRRGRQLPQLPAKSSSVEQGLLNGSRFDFRRSMKNNVLLKVMWHVHWKQQLFVF